MDNSTASDDSGSFTPAQQLPTQNGAPLITGIARRSLKSRLGEDVAGIAGRYRVKSQIARSVRSVLYNAHDEDLGREVAIKVVPAAHASEPELRHRLAREAHIAAMLDHPNIVPIYDLDLGSDGRLYFTTRLINGRSVNAAIEAPPGDDGRVEGLHAQLAVVCGVADALAYAHKHSVVHGDVSSTNIMIGTFGEVILVDWGSATLVGNAAGAISESATVPQVEPDQRYQSPEQARGEPATPASDQYSLAAVAFHMLVGRPPLCLPSDAAANEKFQERKRRGDIDELDARELAKVPKGVLEILRKALSPSPSARFASMAEFSAAFDPFMHGEAGAAAAVRSSSGGQYNLIMLAILISLILVSAANVWYLRFVH
jgi:eukaryotic-like serine/threonine-protein kinase